MGNHNKYQATVSSYVVVKQVRNLPVYDVFTGIGWDNWSRVQWDTKNKRISLIKGDRLNSFELRAVYEKVEQLMHFPEQHKDEL